MAPHNNKTTIYLIQMSSNISNIGLFKRISNNEAECILCKANGETKYLFKLSDRSVKSLITHVRSKIHKDSENAKEFERLVTKEQTTTSSEASIDKFFQQHSSGYFIYFLNYLYFLLF